MVASASIRAVSDPWNTTFPLDASSRTAPRWCVQTCVHCRACRAPRPTRCSEEMDSPRGRIVLMKQVLDGNLAVGDVSWAHGRSRMSARASPPAPPREVQASFSCPSGPKPSSSGSLTRQAARCGRSLLSAARIAGALPGSRRGSGRPVATCPALLPASVRTMLGVRSTPPAAALPALAAPGPRRARVALLAGCVQLNPEVDHTTVRVLAADGSRW